MKSMSRNNRMPLPARSAGRRALLACFLAALLALGGCGTEQAQEQAKLVEGALLQPESINYDTVTAQVQSLTQSQTVDASLYPKEHAIRLEANNVRFVELHVYAGSYVQEGNLIATFSKETDNIRLEEIRLEIRRLEQALEDSLPDYQKAVAQLEEQLDELPFYMREEIAILENRLRLQELAQEQLALSTAYQIDQLTREQEELLQAEEALEVYAPMSGYIGETVYLKEGTLCYEGQLLATVYRPEDCLFSVNNSMGKLRAGMVVEFEYGKKNERKTLTGRIVSAANCLPSSLATDHAYVRLDALPEEWTGGAATEGAADASPASLLNPQITAQVLRLENALLLPRRALQSSEGKYYVSILDGESVHKRFVQLGLSTTDMVWVLDGLSDGQTVIVE